MPPRTMTGGIPGTKSICWARSPELWRSAVEHAYGAERFALLDVEASAAMEIPAAVIIAALSPLGWGKLTASGADMVSA